VMKNISTTIEFIALFKGMFEMDCSGSTTGSLLPLLRQKELKKPESPEYQMQQESR